MTAKEVAEKYGISESTLVHNFKRTAASILKKHNIRLIKKGTGVNVKYIEIEDDRRALQMYNENREVFFVDAQTIELAQWEFLIFLAIIVSPMLVFRGSYEEMLEYMNMPKGKKNCNIEYVKNALEGLAAKDYIMYKIDKTDTDYFMAGLYRAVEQQMGVGISMIRTCKQIADEAHLQSWVPLFKTWVGVQYFSKEIDEGKRDCYTTKDLSQLTGLSEAQIYKYNPVLKKANVYRTEYMYADEITRVGTRATLNAFYPENTIE